VTYVDVSPNIRSTSYFSFLLVTKLLSFIAITYQIICFKQKEKWRKRKNIRGCGGQRLKERNREFTSYGHFPLPPVLTPISDSLVSSSFTSAPPVLTPICRHHICRKAARGLKGLKYIDSDKYELKLVKVRKNTKLEGKGIIEVPDKGNIRHSLLSQMRDISKLTVPEDIYG